MLLSLVDSVLRNRIGEGCQQKEGMLVKLSQSKLELDNCLFRTPIELTPIKGEAGVRYLLFKGELGVEQHFLAKGWFLITASLTGG